MSRRTTRQTAIDAIERRGAQLVFPIANRSEPPSLWSVLHPRVPMRWAWDEGADPRVAELWHLREALARSREVVYSKWYRGRATFFSRALFTTMLAAARASRGGWRGGLPPDAIEMLDLLESDSPRSTRELRRDAGLSGRMFESAFRRGLDRLFTGMLVVGYGEVDDGSFPSLAVGATRTLFEELWEDAMQRDPIESRARVPNMLPAGSPFAKHHAALVRARDALDDDDVADLAIRATASGVGSSIR